MWRAPSDRPYLEGAEAEAALVREQLEESERWGQELRSELDVARAEADDARTTAAANAAAAAAYHKHVSGGAAAYHKHVDDGGGNADAGDGGGSGGGDTGSIGGGGDGKYLDGTNVGDDSDGYDDGAWGYEFGTHADGTYVDGDAVTSAAAVAWAEAEVEAGTEAEVGAVWDAGEAVAVVAGGVRAGMMGSDGAAASAAAAAAAVVIHSHAEAEVEPSRCCSPRHRMPYNPRNEPSTFMTMTWQAISLPGTKPRGSASHWNRHSQTPAKTPRVRMPRHWTRRRRGRARRRRTRVRVHLVRN